MTGKITKTSKPELLRVGRKINTVKNFPLTENNLIESHKIAIPKSDPLIERKKKRILSIAQEEGLKVKGIVLHDNINTLASVDKKKNLRMQEVFLRANAKVIRSLVRVLRRTKRREDVENVNLFIVENPPHKGIKGIPRSLIKDCIGPYGRYHDLEEILAEIMNKHTGPIDGILISWRKQTIGRSSVTWGSYRDLPDGGLIRVNSVLDKKSVPRFVVASVVYHELLHHIVPMESDGILQRVHTKRFNDLLARYPDYYKSESWKLRYFKRISEN